ncbi:MAG: OprD family outer membrane porin [Pseudomonadota bacterium]
MNYKLKLLPLAIAGCIMAAPVAAADNKAAKNTGTVSAQLKSMVILDSADNGYDPSEGTSYLVKLKYETASWNNMKVGLGFYNNGDLLNQTDFDKANDSDKRLARGMFVTDDGSEKSLMGEMYLKYDAGKFGFNAGRQLYDTPLTKITYSTMPNFHTVFGINTTAVPGLKLSLDQVTQMSFGARAMTDFGLIGEGTQTAGSVVRPDVIGQAEFHDISLIATANDSEETNGITVLGGTYSGVKGLKISAWDYYADDISNTFYADANYGMPVGGLKLKLSAQYLTQSEQGSLVEDNPFLPTGNFTDGIDYNLFGLKGVVKWKGLMGFLAYNKSSGDTGMFNSWGGDPAYTSSIFSRNAYRENVSAYKLGVKYSFSKKAFVMLSHADYGQSDSVGRLAGIGNVTALTDARETDLVFVVKPMKGLMLKLFHANRTSEYDGSKDNELTQAHTRFVASYKF